MDGMPRLSRIEREILQMLIAKRDMYGLEMVHASTFLKRGTIYVTLGRMEDKGWITSEAEAVEGQSGLPRRRYRASGAGTKVLYAIKAAESVMLGDALPTGWPS